MSTSNPMLGPSFTSHAREVELARANKSKWPYPYSFPPENAIPVSVGMGPTVPGVATAGIAMPAIGDQALVMQYMVPNGFSFWLRAVIATARTAAALAFLPAGAP